MPISLRPRKSLAKEAITEEKAHASDTSSHARSGQAGLSNLGQQAQQATGFSMHKRTASAQSRPASAAGSQCVAPQQSTSSLRPLRLVASSSNISRKGNSQVQSGAEPGVAHHAAITAHATGPPALSRPEYKRVESASAVAARSRAASPAPSAAESWTQAGDAEGAYIRKTYAHFDSRGVDDDGFAEGREWTRERGQGHPWEQPDWGRKRNISRARSVTPSASAGGTKAPAVNGQRREQAARSVPSSPLVGLRTLTLSPPLEGSAARQVYPARPLRSGALPSERLSPILAESSLDSDVTASRADIRDKATLEPQRPSLEPIRTKSGAGHASSLAQSVGAVASSSRPPGASGSAPILDIVPPTPNPALSPTMPQQENAQISAPSSTLSPRPSSNLVASSSDTWCTTVDQFGSSSDAPRANGSAASRPFSSESVVSLARSEESGISGSRRLEQEQRRPGTVEDEEELTAAMEEREETEQERQTRLAREELLSSIDRYGFFAKELDSSSSRPPRTTILPASAYSKLPSKRTSKPRVASKKMFSPKSSPAMGSEKSPSLAGTSGFAKGVNDDADTIERVRKSRSALEEAMRTRETLRVGKWQRMLRVDSKDDGGNVTAYRLASNLVGSKRLRRRIYKGLPDRWRAAAWWALVHKSPPSKLANGAAGNATTRVKAGTNPRHRRHESGRSHASVPDSSTGSRAGHHSYAESDHVLHDQEHRYAKLIRQPSPHDVQIDLDVPRTISGHVLFHTRYGQGQRGLFHVLHAFSLHCDECAYCQGMGPIAATLLVYLPPERAYACLVAMHDAPKYSLHKTFSPGFPGLVESFYVQEQLTTAYMPDLAQRLSEQDITTSSYATRWYITLFANVVPFQCQIRLWDALLLDGADVLVVFSLAVLWALRDRLSHPNATFETILGALGAELLPEDDDALMAWVEQFGARDDVKKRINKAHEEWHIRELNGDARLA